MFVGADLYLVMCDSKWLTLEANDKHLELVYLTKKEEVEEGGEAMCMYLLCNPSGLKDRWEHRSGWETFSLACRLLLLLRFRHL